MVEEKVLMDRNEFDRIAAFVLQQKTADQPAGRLGFTLVRERTVEVMATAPRWNWFDLEIGQNISPGKFDPELDDAAYLERMKKLGADFRVVEEGNRLGLDVGNTGCLLMPANRSHWDSLSADQLPALIASLTNRPMSPRMLSKQDLPVTLAFKTRDGSEGLLQVIDFPQSLIGVKIRYKLVQTRIPGVPQASEPADSREAPWKLAARANPLEGTWICQDIEPGAGWSSLVIRGSNLEFLGKNTNLLCRATFSLREDTYPKRLIAAITEHPDRQSVGKTVNVIYQIRDDTLTIAANEVGDPAVPAGFDAPKDGKHVLKRKTDVPQAPSLAPAAGTAPLTYPWRMDATGSAEPSVAETGAAFPQGPPFVAHVAGGEIELLGLSHHPSTNQLWWRADGTPWTNAVFKNPTLHYGDTKGQRFEFVLQRRGLPTDVTLEYGFEPGALEVSSGDQPLRQGKALPNHNLVTVLLPESAEDLTIRLGVAAGGWKKMAARTPQAGGGGSFALGDKTCHALFLDPVESGGGARVAVSYNKVPGWTVRVTAMDTGGQLHESFPYGQSENDVATAEGRFTGLPLSRVKEFRFEARPFTYVEFRNVSLELGRPTKVEITDAGDK